MSRRCSPRSSAPTAPPADRSPQERRSASTPPCAQPSTPQYGASYLSATADGKADVADRCRRRGLQLGRVGPAATPARVGLLPLKPLSDPCADRRPAIADRSKTVPILHVVPPLACHGDLVQSFVVYGDGSDRGCCRTAKSHSSWLTLLRTDCLLWTFARCRFTIIVRRCAAAVITAAHCHRTPERQRSRVFMVNEVHGDDIG